MIRFMFRIGWPWEASSCSTRDIFWRDWTIAAHKSLEIQIATWSAVPCLFEIECDTGWKGRDHAGPELFLSVWRFMFSVKVYDHRHWDYDNNTWENHGVNQ